MNKPIIGIIGRPNKTIEESNSIVTLEWPRRSIIKCGGIPVSILPPQDVIYEQESPKDLKRLTDQEKEDLKRVINLCDGIFIPGGTKVYEYDRFIYEYAKKIDIPILGVCAGMQLIASFESKDIKTIVENKTEIDHNKLLDKYVHQVKINNNTILKKIIGKDVIEVNSRHRFHVENISGVEISAYSSDGLIEAVEVPNKKFVLGVQWHPESMIEYDENSFKIIKFFINECKLTNK